MLSEAFQYSGSVPPASLASFLVGIFNIQDVLSRRLLLLSEFLLSQRVGSTLPHRLLHLSSYLAFAVSGGNLSPRFIQKFCSMSHIDKTLVGARSGGSQFRSSVFKSSAASQEWLLCCPLCEIAVRHSLLRCVPSGNLG